MSLLRAPEITPGLTDKEMSRVMARLDTVLNGSIRLPSHLDAEVRRLVRAEDPVAVAALAPKAPPKAARRALVSAALTFLDKRWSALFAACDTSKAKMLSKHDRKTSRNAQKPADTFELRGLDLVYGEVCLLGMAKCLSRHVNFPPAGQWKFYDLGSGVGRGVFAATELHHFKSCFGIELLPSLHASAQHVLASSERKSKRSTEKDATDIKFICGDFRSVDWSDGDLVLANSTCFGPVLMAWLSAASERMRKGSYFVTLTKELKSKHWEIVGRETLRCSWGKATALVHIKVCDASVRHNDK